MAHERTAADIESELAAARQRIANNIASLVQEVHPKAVLHRSVEDGKRQVRETIQGAKQAICDVVNDVRDQFEQEFKGESGWKWDRVAIAGGIVVAIIATGVFFGTRKK